MFSVSHVNTLRVAELDEVMSLFPATGRVLELGAGTGRQASMIAARGYAVDAVDLPQSGYASAREFPVQDYDGRTLPFPDASFDVVFSSNVLEHVRHLEEMHAEIRRVLKPGGTCIHVLPTHTWRLWTSLASIPAVFQYAHAALTRPTWQRFRRLVLQFGVILLQPRHGERGIGLSELWSFSPKAWRRNFAANGFVEVCERPVGIFYTGEMVMGAALSLERRRKLADVLGSACHVYQLRPPQPAH
jgi:SAM-dependent methyltransferase